MFLTGNHLPYLVLQSIEDVLNQIRIKIIGRSAQGRIVAHVNVLPQKFPNVTIQQGSFDESIGLDRKNIQRSPSRSRSRARRRAFSSAKSVGKACKLEARAFAGADLIILSFVK